MPCLGIIRGFGEGEVATGYIIKLIKALKRRFRTKLEFVEIPTGDYSKYGCDLSNYAIDLMSSCDVIFAGDMVSAANPVDYKIEDIALSLRNNIEYVNILSILREKAVDMQIASYFDGGFSLRDGFRGVDGCTETKICSTYSVMDIVRTVSEGCANRRRRLAFVKDGDNEYCADLFYKKFSDFTLPLSNFHLIKFSVRDISSEIIFEPAEFDTIFASETFAKYIAGTLNCILDDKFISYTKFANKKCVYSLTSNLNNSYSNKSVPTMNSYIMALADLLKNELKFEKEAAALRGALERTAQKGKSAGVDCEEFISDLIEELKKPLGGVYKTKEKKITRIR